MNPLGWPGSSFWHYFSEIIHRITDLWHRLLEKEDFFTLSFFEEPYRMALSLFGSVSGRDMDKVKLSGLTPVGDATGAVYYQEARLVLVLRKIYFHDLEPANVRNIDLGEIVKVLRKS